MNSQFRQKLRHVLPDGEQKGQEEFERETGINLEQDIDYVLAWMSPTGEPKDPTGVVMLRGRFDAGPSRVAGDDRMAGRSRSSTASGWFESNEVRRTASILAAVAFLETGPARASVRKRAFAPSWPTGRRLQHLRPMRISRTSSPTSKVPRTSGRSDAWTPLPARRILPEQIASQIPAVKWFAASSADQRRPERCAPRRSARRRGGEEPPRRDSGLPGPCRSCRPARSPSSSRCSSPSSSVARGRRWRSRSKCPGVSSTPIRREGQEARRELRAAR